MKDQDFELISRYLDGELDSLAARRLEKRFAAEPELAATLARLTEQDERIRSALNSADKVPAHVYAMLKPQTNVVALPRSATRPAWQYAVAASLVAAVALVLMPSWQQAPGNDTLLANVLESAPSMPEGWLELEDGSQVRPVLSFEDVDGQWCREYLLSNESQSQRGVACRQDGEWQTLVIADAQIPGDNGDYRPAGSGDTDAVAQFLAERAQGIALSADEEAERLATNWK